MPTLEPETCAVEHVVRPRLATPPEPPPAWARWLDAAALGQRLAWQLGVRVG